MRESARHTGQSSDPAPNWRVGAVSYLNSKPLIEGLAETLRGDPSLEAELCLEVPSRLADALAAGSLDVALIPSVEAFSDPAYQIVSDACVAARGPVLSVKFYSRVPPGAVRSLALDAGSRTSAALVQVMLAERFGVQPDTVTLPLGAGPADVETDAVLLIGDRAIQPPVESFDTVWDLGEEWFDWTGLPFVFAMWVAAAEPPPELAAALCAARDRGTASLRQIARREAPQLRLPEEMVLNYLSRHLHFQLGSAELAGLRLFHQLAAQHGFAGCEQPGGMTQPANGLAVSLSH